MKPKRLSMYLPADIHNRLKQIAARRDVTITRLVLSAVIRLIMYGDKDEKKDV